MTESLAQLSKGALNDLAGVFAAMPEDALDGLIEAIVAAKRIVVFGLGREGLQMRGFAMRLFHMGRDVAVWGDMTTPALGAGDLFIASAGPAISRRRGRWSRSRAKAGARTALVTAQPAGRTREASRHRHGHSRPDDGQRSGRQALCPADGLAVRDRADDRLRARRSSNCARASARPRRRCGRGTPIWSDRVASLGKGARRRRSFGRWPSSDRTEPEGR